MSKQTRNYCIILGIFAVICSIIYANGVSSTITYDIYMSEPSIDIDNSEASVYRHVATNTMSTWSFSQLTPEEAYDRAFDDATMYGFVLDSVSIESIVVE